MPACKSPPDWMNHHPISRGILKAPPFKVVTNVDLIRSMGPEIGHHETGITPAMRFQGKMDPNAR